MQPLPHLLQQADPATTASAAGDPATTTAKPKRKTEYTKVTMKDGREVEFPGKQKILSEILQGPDGSCIGVRFDFRNSEVLEVPRGHGGLSDRFECHGITQKYRDEAAGMEDIDDAYETIMELHVRLGDGKWSEEREGGGAGIGVLVRAVAEFKQKPVEEIRDWLKGRSGKERTVLKNFAPIKAIIDRLEAEKAAASGIDAGALLASA